MAKQNLSKSDIEKRLKSLGVELWPGEAFFLTDPKERAKAADWLHEFLYNT